MVWGGKGRSGIGDVNIQGTHDDWDGLSMNGRQYRNSITQEIRNLSGADYWHARKADYPKQEPETWVNGKANVKAFAGVPNKPPKKPVQKRSAFQQACLADNNYERLQRISDALDDDLESGALSVEDWTYAKKNLQPRIDRAWKRIAKNRGWDEEQEDDYQIEASYHQQHYNTNIQSKKTLTEGDHFINLVFNGLPDDNVFKAGFLFIQKMMRILK